MKYIKQSRKSVSVVMICTLALLVTILGTTSYAQTYVSQWDANGVPINLAPATTISAETLQGINLALPESNDIRITHPEYIASDTQLQIVLQDSADIYVTFIHEGAGFRNTFGCFTYDLNSIPTTTSAITKEVLFPNTSYTGSGGGLQTGDTVMAGRHGPGTTIGFWLTANTWRPATATYVEGSWRHWSIRDLNQETDSNLRPHMVLLSQEDQNLVLGFEDVLRSEAWCDQDFNDVVFMVRADPPEALNINQVTAMPGIEDSDGDGIADYDDSFPNDAERASVQYTPSVTANEVIAFEDKWPALGDYDFNDLVVRYQFRESLAADGTVKEIRAYIDPLARGANYHNGFALQLAVAATNVDTVLAFSGGSPIDAGNLLEADGDDQLVLHAFTDAHTVLPSSGGSGFANTIAGTPAVTADQIELRITFVNAVPRSQLGLPPYNPFIYRTGSRGHEIHLLDHPPSNKVIAAYFGTGDDDSNIDNSEYYRDERGFPWAMVLPEDWQHPLEHKDINLGYSRFDDWVVSSGASYQNWHQVDLNAANIWNK